MAWKEVKPGSVKLDPGDIVIQQSPDLMKFAKQLDPLKFLSFWNKLTITALENIAQVFEAEVRDRIVRGRTVENSPITKILKESNIPLVETERLADSLTHSVSVNAAKVGWPKGLPKYPRSSMNPGKLAKEFHGVGGRIFTITPAMRKLFKYWAWKTQGKVKIANSTTQFYVPRRAPLTDAIESPKVRSELKEKFKETYRAGFDKYFK